MTQLRPVGLRAGDLLDTKQAAEVLGRSPETLRAWRKRGIGPSYYVLGGRPAYTVALLEEYLAEQLVETNGRWRR